MNRTQTTDSSLFPTEELDRLAEGFAGRLGYYVKDLSSAATYECRSDDRFPTASVFKLPVMIALFREAEGGRMSLDDRRRLEPGISTHGTGLLSLTADAPEFTLRDYCRLMISISDNMAADMLLRAVGLDAVNRMLDELELVNTRVPIDIGRWHYSMAHMEQEPITRENDERFTELARAGELDDNSLPFSDSLSNLVASPRDMGVLLERLQRGELAGPDFTEQMIDILKSCAKRDMVPGPLTADILVAHKTGGSRRIANDAGIVYLPSGPMVVAGFSLADPDQP